MPAYLADRRVEITGPTDRKMTINALNSGAKIWLADLEDANTPSWGNVISGQVNLADAIRRTITLDQGGKSYRLNDGDLAVIVTRPRGWHLPEKHLTIDGQPLVGALVDFGLYFFHNAAELLDTGRGSGLLPAEDGIPSRGPALGRGFRVRGVCTRASPPAPFGRPC